MKYLITVASASLLTLLFLTGCDSDKQERMYLSMSVKVYCDKSTNVEYLIFDSFRAGGITVRRNIDGTVKHCTVR